MSRSSSQADKLAEALEARGWFWENQILYAPHRTMWFPELDSWLEDIQSFIQRMEERRDRIIRNKHHHTDQQQHQHIVDDVEGLIEAISELMTEGRNEP